MSMKKTLLLFILSLATMALSAQNRLVERIYVTTDRSAYVVGDMLWCSAFCVDASGSEPALSHFSGIAYLELVSATGSEMTMKIALNQGRGGGAFRIPSSLPTGNYRLIAYTAQNRNETGRSFLEEGKILSIFNTLSTRRVKGGVRVAEFGEYVFRDPEKQESGAVRALIGRQARTSTSVPLILENAGSDATLSVSVSLQDGINDPGNGTVADFLSRLPAPGSISLTEDVLPEYEGEILRGTVEGPDKDKVKYDQTQFAVISTAGAASDTYVSAIRDGEAVFFTNNIYGDRELVCELLGIEEGKDCFLLMESPFLRPASADLPPLVLSPDLREDLLARQASMQMQRTAALDTLVDLLPKRENLLLKGTDAIVYHLDDYTRFPTVQEVVVEIVPELRIRKGKISKEKEIQMLYTDQTGSLTYYMGDILVLLDGVVVSDHARLLDYDALLFEDICIYSAPYTLGAKFYRGIVNFKTKKNGSIALKFSDHTRVFDFQGASLPIAYTGRVLQEKDYRQTIFWHPLIEVGAGSERTLQIRTPDLPGRFKVVVEGLDREGRPIYAETFLDVH